MKTILFIHQTINPFISLRNLAIWGSVGLLVGHMLGTYLSNIQTLGTISNEF